MAVQKSKVTRSSRGMRRSHDKLGKPALTIDTESGEVRRRHHVSANGYYKGKQVIDNSPAEAEESETVEA